MPKLHTHIGNLFPAIDGYFDIYDTVMIPHVVNDIGAWGAGFVIPLAQYCPEARDRYIRRGVDAPQLCLGESIIVEHTSGILIANMCAQHGVGFDAAGRPTIRYAALAKAMATTLSELWAHHYSNARVFRPPAIVCPRFGCGLAGGDVATIFSLIREIWLEGDSAVDVHMHQV